MTVTFNPYGEEEAEEERYNYFPSAAASIFYLEQVIDTIEVNGTPKAPVRCSGCGEADNSKGAHGVGRCR